MVMPLRSFEVTLNQLLNLSRVLELRPLVDALRARWVGLNPRSADTTLIGTVQTSVGEHGEVLLAFTGKPVDPPLVTDPEALRLTVDPPTPRLSTSEDEPRQEPRQTGTIGWVAYEFVAGSEESKRHDAALNSEEQQATGEADALVYGRHRWQRHHRIGWTSIPVLGCLVGQPWDARALNMLDAVRPSTVRVVTDRGMLTADSVAWRVTVTLKEDCRTISAVEQEVEVGLRGWRYGADAAAYMDNREPQPSSSGVFNPRGIGKLKVPR